VSEVIHLIAANVLLLRLAIGASFVHVSLVLDAEASCGGVGLCHSVHTPGASVVKAVSVTVSAIVSGECSCSVLLVGEVS
jgi:hypothetical protein